MATCEAEREEYDECVCYFWGLDERAWIFTISLLLLIGILFVLLK